MATQHLVDIQQTLGHMNLKLREEVWARGRVLRLVGVWMDFISINKRSPREYTQ